MAGMNNLYRKKPVVIEAIQFTGSNYKEVREFSKGNATPLWFGQRPFAMLIPTKEGNMEAFLGDWVIKGVAGEYYPCKPDIFEKTYEKMDDRYDPH